MSLCNAMIGKEYIVKDILTEDEELVAFLLSLGCYQGEPISIISHKRKKYIVAIKDARYYIDSSLARAIHV